MKQELMITWMAKWAAEHDFKLELKGEVGFGRECVGITYDGSYPDYYWYDEDTYTRIDNNGEVWTPVNAYHKHECVAVLGRDEESITQLYKWLQWFENNNFKFETGGLTPDPALGMIAIVLGKHRYVRLVRQDEVQES